MLRIDGRVVMSAWIADTKNCGRLSISPATAVSNIQI